MTTLTTEIINTWADKPDSAVALHLKQKLLPVEGEGAVIFPPTYADIGYNIDTLSDGTKVCTIDSVGSQANRIEPIFKASSPAEAANKLATLVPQIDIIYGNHKKLSILEAGHRLGDAIIRTSKSEGYDLPAKAREAFNDYLQGDATAMAKLAPTSLVFGVWDSRDTFAKLPRIVQSVIRAWDVSPVHRAAQYEPAIDYVAAGLLDEAKDKAESDQRSVRGYRHAPAVWRDDARKERIPGGIVARGPIQRDVTVNFIALRRLTGGDIIKLRRYILGLTLVAATAPIDFFLRSGCFLVVDPDCTAEWQVVNRDGERKPIALNADIAERYADAATAAFGKGHDRIVTCNATLAKDDAAKGDKKDTGRQSASGRGKKAKADAAKDDEASQTG